MMDAVGLDVTVEVPLLDLGAQSRPIRDEILSAIARVVDSQKFILGEEVRCLEEHLAAYCGARFAIGCASGSDALLLALKALGIGPGDEVLTVPYTFFATAGSISLAGARPVFAAEAVRRNPKIKAILPVHLFGGCADMDALNEVARSRNLPVIEDAAQSIGAEYKGRRAGSLGSIGCFSFYPTKNLGACGDGGLCTTNDEALASRMRALRMHGRTGTYYHEWIGLNSRLDAMQAAILSVKLRYLDTWSEGRARNAALYRRLLGERNLPVSVMEPGPFQSRHIYNQFIIRCQHRHTDRRDELQKYLRAHGVGCEIYYPLALHLQPCYADLGYAAGAFPVSEELSRTTLALPIFAELTEEQIEHVVSVIEAFFS